MNQKTLHLPYNQGNLSTCLQVGERAFSALSTLACVPNAFAESPDIVLGSPPWSSWAALRVLLKARRMDVLLFNYGSSLLDPPWRRWFLFDLPFYPKHLKKAMIFQGSDLRVSYPKAILESREIEKNLGNDLMRSTSDGLIPEAEIERKLARVEKMSSYLDRMFYVNPDLSAILPTEAKFMPYPISFQGNGAAYRPVPNRPMRVLHLSTNRVLKGTGLIEAALRQAKASVNIETRVLVKTTRAIALESIQWADVVVDQMCLGWYGMQAIEALLHGKPVLCWLKEEDFLRYLPKYKNIMNGFVNVTHDKLAQAIVRLAEHPEEREKLSIAGVAFVRDVHDPATVVKNAYGDWL